MTFPPATEQDAQATADSEAAAAQAAPSGWAWPAVTAAAAAVMCAAFFLPWMEGAGPFGLRTFSGFDFARLIRNFEITAATTADSTQIRGAAVMLYLVPAAAVNAAVLHAASRLGAVRRDVAGLALSGAGTYAWLVLTSILFLSMVPVNDFSPNVGWPSYGFALTVAGAFTLGIVGLREMGD